MKNILFFLLLLWSYQPVTGQTLYVSPSGNDGNPGTRDRPLASLEGAREQLRILRKSGHLTDTVFVKIQSGTYYLRQPFVLSDEDGGTVQSPVVFTADAEQRPLFCGGLKIAGFEAVRPDLWRVRIPEAAEYGFTFEQLYVNGERRFRAQTPNRGEFYRVKRVEETVLDTLIENRRTRYAIQKVILGEESAGLLNEIEPDETN
ncbi:MAG: hypothetical protein LBD27_08410, partial [Tannerella sp.]|nr:hypothetical protein [Tannerella sp.]